MVKRKIKTGIYQTLIGVEHTRHTNKPRNNISVSLSSRTHRARANRFESNLRNMSQHYEKYWKKSFLSSIIGLSSSPIPICLHLHIGPAAAVDDWRVAVVVMQPPRYRHKSCNTLHWQLGPWVEKER